ncbi:universal stress protein [Haloechinothrix salitolerans]
MVVATDLSDQSGRAVQRAVRLAEQHHAGLTALHVLPPRAANDLAAFARSRLAAQVRQHATNTEVEQVVVTGEVAVEIVSQTRDRSADLVIVGATGAHTFPFVGHTAENLVRVSPCPGARRSSPSQ